jgi:hypothetical protein
VILLSEDTHQIHNMHFWQWDQIENESLWHAIDSKIQMNACQCYSATPISLKLRTTISNGWPSLNCTVQHFETCCPLVLTDCWHCHPTFHCVTHADVRERSVSFAYSGYARAQLACILTFISKGSWSVNCSVSDLSPLTSVTGFLIVSSTFIALL